MNNEKLLPCFRPGCKGTPEPDRRDTGDYGPGWAYFISCNECGVQTREFDTPIEAVIDWNTRPEKTPWLWSNDRIQNFSWNMRDSFEARRVFDAMKQIRDDYELERKNKIFIPAEFRGCLLLTMQKAKNFLTEMVETIEKKLPKKDLEQPSVQVYIDGWKAELAEYNEILKILLEKKDGEEKISK